jgi:hypothetical protein
MYYKLLMFKLILYFLIENPKYIHKIDKIKGVYYGI